LKESSQTHQGIIQGGEVAGKLLRGRLDFRHYSMGVILLALIHKLLLLRMGVFPFNADEAVVALMARHTLQGRWPVFFYGQAYMGSLDASLVALGFSIFGQKVVVIRVVQVLLFLGTVYTTMLLTKLILRSDTAAVFAGLLIALPTVNVTLYSTISLGGYGETMLLGNLLLLLTLRIANNPRGARSYLAWGLLGGLAFWAFGLSLVFIIPGFFVVLWKTFNGLPRRDGVMRMGVLILAIFIGALPWFAQALAQGPALYIQELLGSAIGGASSSNYWLAVTSRMFNLLLLGGSVILGMRPPWEARWLALPLLPFVLAFWLTVAAFTVMRLRESGHDRIGRWLLSGVVGTLLIGFIFTSFGADPSGRYFLPLAVPMALFAADLLDGPNSRVEYPWKIVVIVAILVFNVWGTYQSASQNPPGLTTQFDRVTWIDHSYDEALIEFLEEKGEYRGYTNYWVAYPLAFLSEEKMIFIPQLPYHEDFRYTPRDNRYDPYDLEVALGKRVAYITTNHQALDDELREAFQRHNVTWQERRFGNYLVFYALSKPMRPNELGFEWLSE
jgi:4-amino-4-deoxy-L-arabinose transferase-like glycosyltransferase